MVTSNLGELNIQKLMNILACPRCHGRLIKKDNDLICSNHLCTSMPKKWPVIRGVPVVFDETGSLFKISSFVEQVSCFSRKDIKSILSRLFHLRPNLSRNIAAKNNYVQLSSLLSERRITTGLVIGCGEGGQGIEEIVKTPGLKLVCSDVRWTSKVNVLCDGHQLPFLDESFDIVIAQGVLEHVIDPFRVANEITRVLKQRGLVYSEFPFLQPVHGGAFDFIRLTSTGHRRLWRHFEQISAGACGGPGMALAHVLKSYMRSLLPCILWQRASDLLADWTLWWLKYLDVWAAKTPAGLDCASGYYFMGRKSNIILSDSDIVEFYKGAQ